MTALSTAAMEADESDRRQAIESEWFGVVNQAVDEAFEQAVMLHDEEELRTAMLYNEASQRSKATLEVLHEPVGRDRLWDEENDAFVDAVDVFATGFEFFELHAEEEEDRAIVKKLQRKGFKKILDAHGTVAPFLRLTHVEQARRAAMWAVRCRLQVEIEEAHHRRATTSIHEPVARSLCMTQELEGRRRRRLMNQLLPMHRGHVFEANHGFVAACVGEVEHAERALFTLHRETITDALAVHREEADERVGILNAFSEGPAALPGSLSTSAEVPPSPESEGLTSPKPKTASSSAADPVPDVHRTPGRTATAPGSSPQPTVSSPAASHAYTPARALGGPTEASFAYDAESHRDEAQSVAEAFKAACVAHTVKNRGRATAFRGNNALCAANRLVFGTGERSAAAWDRRDAALAAISEAATDLVELHIPAPGALSDEARAGAVGCLGGPAAAATADGASPSAARPDTFVIDDAMVHVWSLRREARKAHNALRHMSQMLWETGTQWPIVTPCWTLLSHHGRLVSVMWLCPVTSAAPLSPGASSCAQAVLEGLRGFTLQTTRGGVLRVYQGADGLWYMVDVSVAGQPVRGHPESTDTLHIRHALLRREPKTALIEDRTALCFQELVDVVKSTAGSSEASRMTDLLRREVVAKIVHSAALNLSAALPALWEHAAGAVRELHKQRQGLDSSSRRMTPDTKSRPRTPDDADVSSEERLDSLQIIDRIAVHEMVIRAVRTVIDAAMRDAPVPDYAPDEAREIAALEAAEEAWRRIRKGGASYFASEVMPVVWSKFDVPERVVFEFGELSWGVIMQRVSTKCNLEWDKAAKNFDGFSATVALPHSSFELPRPCSIALVNRSGAPVVQNLIMSFVSAVISQAAVTAVKRSSVLPTVRSLFMTRALRLALLCNVEQSELVTFVEECIGCFADWILAAPDAPAQHGGARLGLLRFAAQATLPLNDTVSGIPAALATAILELGKVDSATIDPVDAPLYLASAHLVSASAGKLRLTSREDHLCLAVMAAHVSWRMGLADTRHPKFVDMATFAKLCTAARDYLWLPEPQQYLLAAPLQRRARAPASRERSPSVRERSPTSVGNTSSRPPTPTSLPSSMRTPSSQRGRSTDRRVSIVSDGSSMNLAAASVLSSDPLRMEPIECPAVGLQRMVQVAMAVPLNQRAEAMTHIGAVLVDAALAVANDDVPSDAPITSFLFGEDLDSGLGFDNIQPDAAAFCNGVAKLQRRPTDVALLCGFMVACSLLTKAKLPREDVIRDLQALRTMLESVCRAFTVTHSKKQGPTVREAMRALAGVLCEKLLRLFVDTAAYHAAAPIQALSLWYLSGPDDAPEPVGNAVRTVYVTDRAARRIQRFARYRWLFALAQDEKHAHKALLTEERGSFSALTSAHAIVQLVLGEAKTRVVLGHSLDADFAMLESTRAESFNRSEIECAEAANRELSAAFSRVAALVAVVEPRVRSILEDDEVAGRAAFETALVQLLVRWQIEQDFVAAGHATSLETATACEYAHDVWQWMYRVICPFREAVVSTVRDEQSSTRAILGHLHFIGFQAIVADEVAAVKDLHSSLATASRDSDSRADAHARCAQLEEEWLISATSVVNDEAAATRALVDELERLRRSRIVAEQVEAPLGFVEQLCDVHRLETWGGESAAARQMLLDGAVSGHSIIAANEAEERFRVSERTALEFAEVATRPGVQCDEAEQWRALVEAAAHPPHRQTDDTDEAIDSLSMSGMPTFKESVMIVRIMAARGVDDEMDAWTAPDCFVAVRWADTKHCTTVAEDTLSPAWTDVFAFPLSIARDRGYMPALHVNLYDRDITGNELVGDAAVLLDRFVDAEAGHPVADVRRRWFDGWVRLNVPDSRAEDVPTEVRVRVLFTDEGSADVDIAEADKVALGPLVDAAAESLRPSSARGTPPASDEDALSGSLKSVDENEGETLERTMKAPSTPPPAPEVAQDESDDIQPLSVSGLHDMHTVVLAIDSMPVDIDAVAVDCEGNTAVLTDSERVIRFSVPEAKHKLNISARVSGEASAPIPVDSLFDGGSLAKVMAGSWLPMVVALPAGGPTLNLRLLAATPERVAGYVCQADESLFRSRTISEHASFCNIASLHSSELVSRVHINAELDVASAAVAVGLLHLRETTQRNHLAASLTAKIRVLHVEVRATLAMAFEADSARRAVVIDFVAQIAEPRRRAHLIRSEAAQRSEITSHKQVDRSSMLRTLGTDGLLAEEQQTREGIVSESMRDFAPFEIERLEALGRDRITRLNFAITRASLIDDMRRMLLVAASTKTAAAEARGRGSIEETEQTMRAGITSSATIDVLEERLEQSAREHIAASEASDRGDLVQAWMIGRGTHLSDLQFAEDRARDALMTGWAQGVSRLYMQRDEAQQQLTLRRNRSLNRINFLRQQVISSPQSAAMGNVVDAVVAVTKDRRRIENQEARARRDLRTKSLEDYSLFAFLHNEMASRLDIMRQAQHAWTDLSTQVTNGAADISVCTGKYHATRHMYRKLLQLERDGHAEELRSVIASEAGARNIVLQNYGEWVDSFETRWDLALAETEARAARNVSRALVAEQERNKRKEPAWMKVADEEHSRHPREHAAATLPPADVCPRRYRNTATAALEDLRRELAELDPKYDGDGYVPTADALPPLRQTRPAPAAGLDGPVESSRQQRLMERNGSAPARRRTAVPAAADARPADESVVASTVPPQTPRKLPPLAKALRSAVEADGTAALEKPPTSAGALDASFARAHHTNAVSITAMHNQLAALERPTRVSRLDKIGQRPASGGRLLRGGTLDELHAHTARVEAWKAPVLLLQRFVRMKLASRSTALREARPLAKVPRPRRKPVAPSDVNVLRRKNLQVALRSAFMKWAAPFVPQDETPARAVIVQQLVCRNTSMVMRNRWQHWFMVVSMKQAVSSRARQCHRLALRSCYQRWLAKTAIAPSVGHAAAPAAHLASIVAQRHLTRRWAAWLRFYVERVEKRARELTQTD